MRIEKAFTPFKLCLDSKDDVELLKYVCQEFLERQSDRWYNVLGSSIPNRKKEEYYAIKNLLEMLK